MKENRKVLVLVQVSRCGDEHLQEFTGGNEVITATLLSVFLLRKPGGCISSTPAEFKQFKQFQGPFRILL